MGFVKEGQGRGSSAAVFTGYSAGNTFLQTVTVFLPFCLDWYMASSAAFMMASRVLFRDTFFLTFFLREATPMLMVIMFLILSAGSSLDVSFSRKTNPSIVFLSSSARNLVF